MGGMAKSKRVKWPLFATAAFVTYSFLLSLRTKQNKAQRSKNKTGHCHLTMRVVGVLRIYVRLRYLAILSKSVTINSMMCTEIMRQAAINFRFIGHGLSSRSIPHLTYTQHIHTHTIRCFLFLIFFEVLSLSLLSFVDLLLLLLSCVPGH